MRELALDLVDPDNPDTVKQSSEQYKQTSVQQDHTINVGHKLNYKRYVIINPRIIFAFQYRFKLAPKKSRIRETPNLSTDADSSTDTYFPRRPQRSW